MGKVKSAREEWFDKFVNAMLELEPRLAGDDVWEQAWRFSGERASENPSTAAFLEIFPSGKVELGPHVSPPDWMERGEAAPPGWRFVCGSWRND